MNTELATIQARITYRKGAAPIGIINPLYLPTCPACYQFRVSVVKTNTKT